MYREPAKRPPEPEVVEENEKKRAVLARWRTAAIVLAIVVPLLSFFVFERQARRLEALADHGVRVEAVVVSDVTYTDYEYRVDGARYRWSVRREDAPYRTGTTFAVQVLPELPSFSRPGKDGSAAAREAAGNRARFPFYVLAAFAFFSLLAAAIHRDVRRLEDPPPRRRAIDLRTFARAIGIFLVLVMLSANLDGDVHATQMAAFGARPLGLPVRLVCTVVEALLFLPFVPVVEHLVYLLVRAQRGDVAPVPELVLYGTASAPPRPDHGRSLAIVLAGIVYFVVVCGAWIAFTSARGI